MGTLYLTNLADILYGAGLSIVEYGDWKTRARGSGGYDAMPLCVMWHHTASPQSWDGQKDADYCAVGDSDAPLANLYIDRSGTVWILAAGATNTNGKGKSITFSRGTVPNDSMNTRALGVELGNDGVGEMWSRVQVDAMFTVSNICNSVFGNRADDVSSHQFYAPDRKIDPATTNVEGPWKPTSCTSSDSWDRASIQSECLARASQPLPPQPSEDDDMAYPCEGIWTYTGADAINGALYAVYSGGYKVWITDNDSLAAKQALLTLHAVPSGVQGQSDRAMFAAFGPVVGPVPNDGTDAYGLPSR